MSYLFLRHTDSVIADVYFVMVRGLFQLDSNRTVIGRKFNGIADKVGPDLKQQSFLTGIIYFRKVEVEGDIFSAPFRLKEYYRFTELLVKAIAHRSVKRVLMFELCKAEYIYL